MFVANKNSKKYSKCVEKNMLTIIINKKQDGQSMNLPTPSQFFLKKYLIQIFSMLCLFSLLVMANIANAEEAAPNVIQDVQYSTLPGSRLQISLELSEHAVTPLSFTIDNPARIAFDFADTGSKLSKRSQPIGIGVAQSMTTIPTKTKTRVILNLTEVVPYQVTTQGNKVLITLDSEATGTAFEATAAAATTTAGNSTSSQRFADTPRGVKNIDFRRGEEGEGRVVINLTETNIPMDISEEFGKVRSAASKKRTM
jgi:type IV pilus assembly protein PilQ